MIVNNLENDNNIYLFPQDLSTKSSGLIFWTNGKQIRVVIAREMSEDEQNFYERKNASLD